MGDIDIHSVPTLTHGRILVRRARSAAALGLIVGFHGYMENAAMQLARLEEIPGAQAWTLVAIQGLHRFYRGRSETVVASWMTREDRDDAIADNLAYVSAALEAVPHHGATRIWYAGFSQGVAMAFRAAARGPGPASGIVAVGGDVPPELLDDASVTFPPTLLIRGRDDEWYTQTKFEADAAAVTARGAAVRQVLVDGGHEWEEQVSRAVGAFLGESRQS